MPLGIVQIEPGQKPNSKPTCLIRQTHNRVKHNQLTTEIHESTYKSKLERRFGTVQAALSAMQSGVVSS